MKIKPIVSASMLASDGNLSKVGSFQIIQDAITELMGKLKIDGFTVKEKHNALWLFTKTRTRFVKTITWNEEITVSSYISLISVARLNVDVEIKDKSGEIALCSKTELCALNIDTQRIVKLSSLGIDNSMLESREPVNVEFTKFCGSDLQPIDNIQIKYTNIDFSHHTNNLEYIRFIMNTYSVEEMESKQISEMEIIYCNQSFENDILKIRKASQGNKDLILIEKDDMQVVKCEIVFFE